MPYSSEATMRSRDPYDFECWGWRPEEVFCPCWGWDGRVGGRGHASVALKGARVVDREEEEDIARRGVCCGEEREILFLGGPRTLRTLGDVR